MPRISSSNPRQWRSVADAADYLGLSQRSIRRYIAEGRFPAYKVGGLVRIDQLDLDVFARRIPVASPAAARVPA